MKLKDIREEYGLNQIQVAHILGVKRGTYSMWELERDIIPLRRLNEFCNFFHVSIDYALGLTLNKKYFHMKQQLDYEKTKERLKKLRIENNLTQEKLSNNLNITRSLISKYENGTNFILTNFLLEYSKYFHISCDYLLGKIDDEIILEEKIYS